MLRDFARYLGLPFSDNEKKSLEIALRRCFLGVETDFSLFSSQRLIVCSVSESRQTTLLDFCQRALASGDFESSGGVDRFCGKLQFALTWSTNRVGRAVMQPLNVLAARAQAGHGECLNAAARRAVEFFEAILGIGLSGRRYALRRRKRRAILVWSDACWEPESDRLAGIGFVIFVPDESSADEAAGKWYYAYHRVTPEFMERFVLRTQYIGQLEMLAAVAVYYSMAHHPELASHLRDAPVMHYIDNYSAVSALVKGYASAIDSARIVHAFWALVAGLGFVPWLSYVRTKGNIADVPSRLLETRSASEEAAFAAELAFLTTELKAEYMETVLPEVADWPTMAAAAAAVVRDGGVAVNTPGAGPSQAAAPKRRRR